MELTVKALASILLLVATTRAEPNLIPNGQFDAPEPLAGWRVAFPHEGWYARNHLYVKADAQHAKGPGKCAMIDLPHGIAGNQGGKIESAFVPAEPGATYRVQVDCMTWDFNAKIHAEAYTTDPSDDPRPSKFRVPASGTLPVLVMVYRAQLPDPPGVSRQWTTVSREFTLPATVSVRGRVRKPEYLVLKAVVFAPTTEGGQSYFDNFRLVRIK